MRLLALLPAALFLSPFAAAQDTLRTEIRKIVREEIRAAMQELHGTVAPTMVAPKVVEGKVIASKAVEVKPIGSAPIEVRIADQTAKWEDVPAHSFQWVTGEKDAAGGKVLHFIDGKAGESPTKGLKVQKAHNVQGEHGNFTVHFAESADEPAHEPTQKGNVFYFQPSTGSHAVTIVKAKDGQAKATSTSTECQVECTTETKPATSSCCEAAKAASECCEGEECEACEVAVKAAKAEKKQKKEKEDGKKKGKKKSKKAKPQEEEEQEQIELKVG